MKKISFYDIVDVKWHHIYGYHPTGLTREKIEINMKDAQKIFIKGRDKHFYKLGMYLEQNKLLHK